MLVKTIFLWGCLIHCAALIADESAASHHLVYVSSALAGSAHEGIDVTEPDELLADYKKKVKELEEPQWASEVQKLGESINPESKRILLEIFKGLSQGRPAADTNQRQKVAVLRALLPKLEPSERTSFLLSTLRDEISAIRAAEAYERGLYYPKDLANLALAMLEEDGLSGDIRDELAGYSADHSIPQDVREQDLPQKLRWFLAESLMALVFASFGSGSAVF